MSLLIKYTSSRSCGWFRMLLTSMLLLLILPDLTIGQTKESTLSVTATGYGKISEEARKSALREALEQSFGVFLTSSSKVVNDRLVEDQISSVTHGIILDFKVLSETQVNQDVWTVTVEALVSVDKVVQYAVSKGYKVDFKGGLFALNIYQQQLNERSERASVENMISILEKVTHVSFDYEVTARSPISSGMSNEWKIPLEVLVKVNPNFSNVAKIIHSTLTPISLDAASIAEYQSKLQPVYIVNVMMPAKGTLSKYATFYLRNKASIDLMEVFVNRFKKTIVSFTIDDGQSQRAIDEFEAQVEEYPTYIDKSPIKQDFFRVAAFQIYNKAIITPSLYQTEYLTIYLPDLSDFVVGYVPPTMNKSEGYGYLVTENGFYDDCKCFPGLLRLPGGMVLQFNKVSDQTGLVMKIRVFDRKTTEELKKMSGYVVSRSIQ